MSKQQAAEKMVFTVRLLTSPSLATAKLQNTLHVTSDEGEASSVNLDVRPAASFDACGNISGSSSLTLRAIHRYLRFVGRSLLQAAFQFALPLDRLPARSTTLI
jgi:hypothetical protein